MGGAPAAALPPTSRYTIGPVFPRTVFQPADNDLRGAMHGAAPTRRGRVTRAGGLPSLKRTPFFED